MKYFCLLRRLVGCYHRSSFDKFDVSFVVLRNRLFLDAAFGKGFAIQLAVASGRLLFSLLFFNLKIENE